MSYTQASKDRSNTESILKIKKVFPTLKANNIDSIQQMINGNSKPKPHIYMTIKGLSRKQIITPMNNANINNFMRESSTHITNMNRALKNIKMNIMVDFVWSDYNGIIIMTNKVVSNSELQMIENYVKTTNGVEASRLPQSKFYLKIIGIPFLQENTNTSINSSIVKDIIKRNYIFNNIILASKPHIIKVSPKLDITII